MDSKQIQDIIPHRYPFLFVDRIVEIEPGKRAVGIKNVSSNEAFFQGHFPDYPVMPGVLIAEALAQVAAVSMMALDEYKGKIGFLAGLDKFRFRRQVKPGDVLRLETELLRLRGKLGKAKAVAKVGDEIACEGELMFGIS